MNIRVVNIIFICALTLSHVTSSPILPQFSLRKISAIDICLFMCNICFDDMGVEMMNCANNVCMAKHEYEMILGLLKLGHSCKNYGQLDAFIFDKKQTDTVDETNFTK